MRDPYEVLGVHRTASEDDIKAAFRALAKRYHPDMDPSNARIAEQFKEVNAAYEFLKDKTKRRRYDRGDIDATGARKRRSAGASGFRSSGGFSAQRRPFTGAEGFTGTSGFAGPHRFRQNGAGGANQTNGQSSEGEASGAPDAQGAQTPGSGAGQSAFNFGYEPGQAGPGASRFDDLFSELFGGLKGGGAAGPDTAPRRGEDVGYRLKVTFVEAVNGATRRVRLPNGRRLDVRIPPAVKPEQQIRLRGMGNPGRQGGGDGDALITIEVEQHPFFRRDGNDVQLELPVTIDEAVLGARIRVPTVGGPVEMLIPEGSNTGTVLRLKGKGIRSGIGEDEAAGDQYVTLKVVLPDHPPKDFQKMVRKLSQKAPYRVRGGFGIDED